MLLILMQLWGEQASEVDAARLDLRDANAKRIALERSNQEKKEEIMKLGLQLKHSAANTARAEKQICEVKQKLQTTEDARRLCLCPAPIIQRLCPPILKLPHETAFTR